MISAKQLETKKTEIALKLTAVIEARSNLDGLGDRLEEVNSKIFHAEKDRQDKLMRLEKEISIHELKVVEEAVKKNNKRTIDSIEMTQLQMLKNSGDQERIREKREFADRVRSQLEIESRMMELKFQQDYATEEQTLKASEEEIKSLKNTIQNLQRDVASQKALSGQLATAKTQK